MKHFLLLASFAIGSLSVIAQPVITSNPQNAMFCYDTCTTLNVAAVGTGLNYQWQHEDNGVFVNVTNNSSATTNALLLCDDDFALDSAKLIRCIVTDFNNDTAISNEATVTIDSCLAPVAGFDFLLNGSIICFTNTSLHATSILWNFGNNSTSNELNPCNDYGTAWIYDVTIYAFNEFGGDTFTRTIDMVGMEDLSAQFRMFPNPVADVFHIQSVLHVDAIEVYNAQGQLVMQKNIGTSNPSIDLSSLESGFYSIVIRTGDKALNHKLLKH